MLLNYFYVKIFDMKLNYSTQNSKFLSNKLLGNFMYRIYPYIYPYRCPQVYFLQMIFDLAYKQAWRLFSRDRPIMFIF